MTLWLVLGSFWRVTAGRLIECSAQAPSAAYADCAGNVQDVAVCRPGPSAVAVRAVANLSHLSMTARVDIDMTARERSPTVMVLDSAVAPLGSGVNGDRGQ